MADTNDGPKKVWFFQPRVEHYRVPVWDMLQQRAGDDYSLTVLGPLQDSGAFGGPARDYMRPFPHDEFYRLGQQFTRWSGAEQAVRNERPHVVILAANPRSTTSWALPAICRRVGAASVCWTKVHSFSGALPGPVMRQVKRRLFKRFDRAICYGESSRRDLLGLGFPPERARVAQNTIDTGLIFQRGEQLAHRGRELRREFSLEGRALIVSIGRMDAEKRHGDLLDAWPRLKAIDSSLSMVLISGGPLLESVRRRASQVDAQSIHVTGRVPEGDDYAWLAAADLAIFPGAVGLAINQSLAIGCPTIIADEPGADAEIVVHGKTGWRYARGDIDALIETVNLVRGDDTQRHGVVDRAIGMMKDKVTIGNMVSSIDATIREAIEVAVQRRRVI